MMGIKAFFVALSLGLLASCTQTTPLEAIQNTRARKVSQKARTRSDHDALTKYFEDTAREMHNKAEEQKNYLSITSKKVISTAVRLRIWNRTLRLSFANMKRPKRPINEG